MSSVKVHYDGWLALPETLRRRLDLTTGMELEVELIDGTIVLRPAAGKAAVRQHSTETELLADPAEDRVELASAKPAAKSQALPNRLPWRRRPSGVHLAAKKVMPVGAEPRTGSRAKLLTALAPGPRQRVRKADTT